MGKIFEFLREYGLALLVGVVGLSCFGYGFWQAIAPPPVVVEISHDTDAESRVAKQLVVDVSGAVVNPGVYTLPEGSRVGEVLVAAGGLAASADHAWVSATLNLATPVKDGEKIYIPAQSLPMQGETENRSDTTYASDTAGSRAKVNINTASESELDTLWGIGPSRATAIIAGRPYGTTDEIVAKAGVPQSVYDKIKDGITVY